MPRREKRPDERVPGKPILLSRPPCSADWRKSATPFAYSPGVQCRDRLTAGRRWIRTNGPAKEKLPSGATMWFPLTALPIEHADEFLAWIVDGASCYIRQGGFKIIESTLHGGFDRFRLLSPRGSLVRCCPSLSAIS